VSRTTQETVSFSCEGFTLRGSLHRPAASAQADTAIVILNQGPLDRSGAHRLSVKCARRWADHGFPVLRFDARGVGDSEGDWAVPEDGAPIKLLYKNIEDGAWTLDTRAAVDYVCATTAVRQVVLAGVCGGAVSALHAAAQHPAVVGVIMVGMPVRPWGDIGIDSIVASQVEQEAKGYVKKLGKLNAWRRFFTGESDYRVLWGIGTRYVRSRVFGESNPQLKSLNASMLKSFHAVEASGKRMLFVFPENDYLWVEFRDLFLTTFKDRPPFDLHIIPDANHTFTEVAWQEQLFSILENWLQTLMSTVPL
jgi:pimeloyl-ACP methyl ester carboxylesterase